MSFQARCPECENTVTTITVLGGSDLDRVLQNGSDVEVICFSQEHKWKLNDQDKANLRNELDRRR